MAVDPSISSTKSRKDTAISAGFSIDVDSSVQKVFIELFAPWSDACADTPCGAALVDGLPFLPSTSIPAAFVGSLFMDL